MAVFMVTKKAGKQRLIIDARRTNKLFQKTPCALLGSGDCWGRIEIEDDLFIAQPGVSDALFFFF